MCDFFKFSFDFIFSFSFFLNINFKFNCVVCNIIAREDSEENAVRHDIEIECEKGKKNEKVL